MSRLAPTEAVEQLVEDSVPPRRMGHADDIGNAALMLAQHAADAQQKSPAPESGASHDQVIVYR